MIYLLDSNAISDYMAKHPSFMQHLNRVNQELHRIVSCQVVYYEIMREMQRRNAIVQIKRFNQLVLPFFEWHNIESDDWFLAANLWADARNRGYQVKDMDLLIAAIALRLSAVLVSTDSDFDSLPVQRENWHQP